MSKTCGYPVRVSRTRDRAPVECDLCSNKLAKFLQDILNSKTPSVCMSACDKWRYKNKLRERVQEEIKSFKGICGEVETFFKPGILIAEKAPNKCQVEKNEECSKRAVNQIAGQWKECVKKTEAVSDECRRYEARLECFSDAKDALYEWREFCNIKVKVDLSMSDPPARCIEGNQDIGPSGPVSLPDVITRPQPGVTAVGQSTQAANNSS